MAQNDVKLIAVINLFVTSLGGTIIGYNQLWCELIWVLCVYIENNWHVILINTLLFLFLIGSDILGLIGAIKQIKNLLIPFVISQVLVMLLWVLLAFKFIDIIVLVVSFLSIPHSNIIGAITWFVILFTSLGLPIYFVIITVKYYNDLSKLNETSTVVSQEPKEDTARDNSVEEESIRLLVPLYSRKISCDLCQNTVLTVE